MSHTPTPWEYLEDTGEIFPKDRNQSQYPIAESVKASNGKFIIHAINSHDELLEAAKVALEELDPWEVSSDKIEKLKKAIEKAEAK